MCDTGILIQPASRGILLVLYISVLLWMYLFLCVFRDLRNNGIRHIEDKALEGAHYLEELQLTENELTTLSAATFYGLKALKTLSVPGVCCIICSLMYFNWKKCFIETSHLQTTFLSHYGSFLCGDLKCLLLFALNI